mmetsp:Transcript_64326/g.106917  ORF Transcript_64326/g.106917 Transcript_64326/m.106917 type:complete len:85 (+) Transcript_64326:434-688(+)
MRQDKADVPSETAVASLTTQHETVHSATIAQASVSQTKQHTTLVAAVKVSIALVECHVSVAAQTLDVTISGQRSGMGELRGQAN